MGLIAGLFTFSDIVSIDYETAGLNGIIFEGIYGILDVAVSTILLYGLIAVAVDGGMLEKCCSLILSGKFTKTKRGAETVLTLGIVDHQHSSCGLCAAVNPDVRRHGGQDRPGERYFAGAPEYPADS